MGNNFSTAAERHLGQTDSNSTSEASNYSHVYSSIGKDGTSELVRHSRTQTRDVRRKAYRRSIISDCFRPQKDECQTYQTCEMQIADTGVENLEKNQHRASTGQVPVKPLVRKISLDAEQIKGRKLSRNRSRSKGDVSKKPSIVLTTRSDRVAPSERRVSFSEVILAEGERRSSVTIERVGNGEILITNAPMPFEMSKEIRRVSLSQDCREKQNYERQEKDGHAVTEKKTCECALGIDKNYPKHMTSDKKRQMSKTATRASNSSQCRCQKCPRNNMSHRRSSHLGESSDPASAKQRARKGVTRYSEGSSSAHRGPNYSVTVEIHHKNGTVPQEYDASITDSNARVIYVKNTPASQ